MKFFQFIVALVISVNSCLGVPVATSHQSMVSGDGYRYSYGIVHGPPGIGHAVGESYPHGYGGFGTYAPSYGYEGYGLGHGHDLHHHAPALVPHVPVAPIPVVTKPIVPLPAVPLAIHKPLEPLPVIHKPLEEHPVITKPLTIPFEDYVLSSPGHHYGYGDHHYGYGDHHYGYGDHHYGYGVPQYSYGVPHYGYALPHYGEPHYGVTHLENSLYDHHYSSLYDHHDDHDDHHDDHSDHISPLYGHGGYSVYKPSYHSYY